MRSKQKTCINCGLETQKTDTKTCNTCKLLFQKEFLEEKVTIAQKKLDITTARAEKAKRAFEYQSWKLDEEAKKLQEAKNNLEKFLKEDK